MTDTSIAKRNCFPGFHRWTKWEQYNWTGRVFGYRVAPCSEGTPISERRQRRHCVDCGKEQDEIVRNG